MYQCYTPKPTNTYGTEERCVSNLGWLASRPKCSNTVIPQKAPGMQKAATGHFDVLYELDVTSINVSYFFTITKTVSISCN